MPVETRASAKREGERTTGGGVMARVAPVARVHQSSHSETPKMNCVLNGTCSRRMVSRDAAHSRP